MIGTLVNALAQYAIPKIGNKVFGGSENTAAPAQKDGFDWMSLLKYLSAAGTGAALGGLAGKEGVFGGSPGKEMQFQRFNPEQQQGQSAMLQKALGGLGGNQFDFAPIEQHARTQFKEQGIPSIAERFTQMGGSDTRLGSSGFGQALSSGEKGLDEGLAAQKAGYGLDQQKMLMGLLGLGMTPQYDTAYRPRQAGLFESGAQGLMSSLPLLALMSSGFGQAQGYLPGSQRQ